jgi:hypothetical protein
MDTEQPVAMNALEGAVVRLEPLGPQHGPDLADAVGGDRSSFAYAKVPEPDQLGPYIADHLQRVASGESVVYAQIRAADAKAFGVTSFLNLRPWSNGGGRYSPEVALRATPLAVLALASRAFLRRIRSCFQRTVERAPLPIRATLVAQVLHRRIDEAEVLRGAEVIGSGQGDQAGVG